MRNAKIMLQQKTTNLRAKGQDRNDATYFVEMGSFHMTMAMELGYRGVGEGGRGGEGGSYQCESHILKTCDLWDNFNNGHKPLVM